MGSSTGIIAAAHQSASAAAAFSPTDVAGLALWLDAADTATITAAAGLVSAWADKSGAGRNGSQGNATFKWTTGVGTINGHNALTAAEFINEKTVECDLSGIGSISKFSVFTVFALNTGQADFGLHDGVNNRPSLYLPYCDGDFKNIQGFQVAGSAGDTAQCTFAAAGTAGQPMLWRMTVDGTGAHAHWKKSNDDDTGDTSYTPSAFTPDNQYQVGKANARKSPGYLCEDLFYAADLAGGDITAIENYLIAKWAVA